MFIMPEQEIRIVTQKLAEEVIKFFKPRLCNVIVVMDGAFMFAADFLRTAQPVVCTTHFVKVSRGYSQGKPHPPYLQGEWPHVTSVHPVLILDVIAETGRTLRFLHKKWPHAFDCVLIRKGEDSHPTFVGVQVPKSAGRLTGYGMGPHRELPYIMSCDETTPL